jgi:hypothetical protein
VTELPILLHTQKLYNIVHITTFVVDLVPELGVTCCVSVHVQSSRQECSSGGGRFTGGRTKGLLLVEDSVTHHGVTLLHTD